MGKINIKDTSKKIALITGVTGQDGSYLAEFLLKKVMKFMELKGDQAVLIHQELIIFIKILTKIIAILFFITEI